MISQPDENLTRGLQERFEKPWNNKIYLKTSVLPQTLHNLLLFIKFPCIIDKIRKGCESLKLTIVLNQAEREPDVIDKKKEEVATKEERLVIYGATSSSQFHQHFMSSFCTNFLLPKKKKTKAVSTKQMFKRLLYKKAAHKMMVKSTSSSVFLFSERREEKKLCRRLLSLLSQWHPMLTKLTTVIYISIYLRTCYRLPQGVGLTLARYVDHYCTLGFIRLTLALHPFILTLGVLKQYIC